jgi:hypothetical protein
MNRLAFCNQFGNKDETWWNENILFSDETLFQLQPSHQHYIRRPPSSRYKPKFIRPRFHHPVKVMAWGCFCASGVAALEIMPPGTMVNSKRYVDILEKNLPVSMIWSQATMFMHDKAPCHSSKMTTAWLADKHINILPWPGNSPDLNPIENLWSVMKASVHRKSPRTVDELRQVIENVWQTTITPDYCQQLVSSMPGRLKEVKTRKGGTSHY